MQTLEASIIGKLKVAEREGKLDDLEIEYWVGGGQPPPYYKSEQFRIYSKDGKPQMRFSILRFSSKLKPPDVTETFVLAVDRPDIMTVAHLLVTKQVFVTRFPEEADPGIGSVISHELAATAGAEKIKRVYYRTMPTKLKELENVMKKLIDRTKKSGAHSWQHQGKVIENPFPE